MGIGNVIGNSTTKIGDVTGHDWPINSTLHQLVKKEGESEDALVIKWSDGEYVFRHEDVKYACICGIGVCNETSSGPIYGVKYRVELNDGKSMIITSVYNKKGIAGVLVTTSYIERVLF